VTVNSIHAFVRKSATKVRLEWQRSQGNLRDSVCSCGVLWPLKHGGCDLKKHTTTVVLRFHVLGAFAGKTQMLAIIIGLVPEAAGSPFAPKYSYF
jgi:hypothetical protein